MPSECAWWDLVRLPLFPFQLNSSSLYDASNFSFHTLCLWSTKFSAQLIHFLLYGQQMKSSP